MGKGLPLMTAKRGRRVPIHDGEGLCSPGRWSISRRKLPSKPIDARFTRLLIELLIENAKVTGTTLDELWKKVGAGALTDSPFYQNTGALYRWKTADLF